MKRFAKALPVVPQAGAQCLSTAVLPAPNPKPAALTKSSPSPDEFLPDLRHDLVLEPSARDQFPSPAAVAVAHS